MCTVGRETRVEPLGAERTGIVPALSTCPRDPKGSGVVSFQGQRIGLAACIPCLFKIPLWITIPPI